MFDSIKRCCRCLRYIYSILPVLDDDGNSFLRLVCCCFKRGGKWAAKFLRVFKISSVARKFVFLSLSKNTAVMCWNWPFDDIITRNRRYLVSLVCLLRWKSEIIFLCLAAMNDYTVESRKMNEWTCSGEFLFWANWSFSDNTGRRKERWFVWKNELDFISFFFSEVIFWVYKIWFSKQELIKKKRN